MLGDVVDRERIEPILAHELIHVRRGDAWTALAQVLATTVWWFHPLIWRSSQQLSRQREKCCDEAVVAITGCNGACYAQELINGALSAHQLRFTSALVFGP